MAEPSMDVLIILIVNLLKRVNEVLKWEDTLPFLLFCAKYLKFLEKEEKVGRNYKPHEFNKSDFLRNNYISPMAYRVRIRVAE